VCQPTADSNLIYGTSCQLVSFSLAAGQKEKKSSPVNVQLTDATGKILASRELTRRSMFNTGKIL
jgi:hypothetical protein